MGSFLDPTSTIVPVKVSLRRSTVGGGGSYWLAQKWRRSRYGRVVLFINYIPVILFDQFLHSSPCIADVALATFAENPVDRTLSCLAGSTPVSFGCTYSQNTQRVLLTTKDFH